ncbi:MAG: tRNA guanosine(34) transglycosylase Tgt [Planctomycetota bacterium]|nr:tRNA guanosine(34) transglycosylase Tgt [Planctomycetota bacterium]
MTKTTSGLEHQVTHSCGSARVGRITVRQRTIETPAFLPVGTYGSVKGVPPDRLANVGSQMILANACHLHDRPGEEVIAALGGLHKFMNWDGPILTDSGGFQVFSMLNVAKLDDQGVSFQSPINGRRLRLGPTEAVDIQLALDSDIAMAFDHCPPLPADRSLLETAVRRTTDWAAKALAHHRATSTRGQALFAIVQGGLDDELRKQSARELTALDFDGFAMGGLSVGETSEELRTATKRYAELLPANRVRYIMGVGRPGDILTAIASGFDIFDCVLPTRNGRHGSLFTSEGTIHLRNSRFKKATGAADPDCDCETCTEWDLGVLRHLIMTGEALGGMLCSVHNLRFLHRLVEQARSAIQAGEFEAFYTSSPHIR